MNQHHAGASHGGTGYTIGAGYATNAPYGDLRQPVALGTGAGISNHGGGAIKLVVSGTLTLDGTIAADGATVAHASYGGGSGGSVWLDVGTLTGAGAIRADGGGLGRQTRPTPAVAAVAWRCITATRAPSA